MEQGGDPFAIELDVAGGSRTALVDEDVAVVPDELLALGKPVDDVEGGIVKGSGEGVPQRGASGGEVEEELADGRAGEPSPQHPG